MTSIAISVDAIGKQYNLGYSGRRSTTFREALTSSARKLSSPFGRRPRSQTFWALRDISFKVERGEVVGIIGANGAGKSTLLKILSRITCPTEGSARIFGRVGSLLEVGTGFHPELSGGENILLNGAILGMRRREIEGKFDEIVAFAEVDRFIDTPVKHYSSGMYLRLAFAVAAHLEPEILMVDEVLAVGDAAFQKKCLGKMGEVAAEGRTVLFVSHNLAAVQRLCSRAILLSKGRIVIDGEVKDAVTKYASADCQETPPGQWFDLPARNGFSSPRLVKVKYCNPSASDGLPCPGGALDMEVGVEASSMVPSATVGFVLRDHLDVTLLAASNRAIGTLINLPVGLSTWRFRIGSLALRPGLYRVDLWVGDATETRDIREAALQLEVFDWQKPGFGTGYSRQHDGFLYCEYQLDETGALEPLKISHKKNM